LRRLEKILFMKYWKTVETLIRPKDIKDHSKNLQWIQNAVFYLLSLAI